MTNTYCAANWTPDTNNIYNLGVKGRAWKDLYLNGKVDFGTKVEGRTNTSYITTDQYDGIGFFINGSKIVNIYDNVIYFAKSAIPSASASFDLGGSSNLFRDVYISRNITDGTNTIAVANIPSKEYVDNAIQQAITNVLTKEF